MSNVPNAELVACCGLYCGQCGAYKKGKCVGCAAATNRGWCPVKKCCKEHGYASCAECKEFPDPADCRKFNSFVSKMFSFFFNSDRRAGVLKIRELGREGFAGYMNDLGRQAIRRR